MSFYADPNYPAHRHYRPSTSYLAPAGADPQLWQYFSAVDTNRSGALSIGELQNALGNGEDHPIVPKSS